MKTKLNSINIRALTKYIYLITLVFGLILAGYLYFFIKNNVYTVFVIDQAEMNMRKNTNAGDMDIAKFEKIIGQLENKTKRNSIGKVNNIFVPGDAQNERDEQTMPESETGDEIQMN
jgi:hypothetical protein